MFKLNTLELVDQLIIEDDTDARHGDCCGIDTLYPTRDELIFRCYHYKEGKEEIDWITVDKIYLEKIIAQRMQNLFTVE